MLDRLNRLEQSARQAAGGRRARRRARAVPLPQVVVATSRGAPGSRSVVLLVVIVAAAAFAAGAFRSDWRMLLRTPTGADRRTRSCGPRATKRSLPRRGETALARARALVAAAACATRWPRSISSGRPIRRRPTPTGCAPTFSGS